MAVNRDVVRDRASAPTRAVGVAEVLHEQDRRARDVARGLEVVVAARGETERDHVDVRVHRLERVVTRSHRRLLHRACDAVAGCVELRLVEARLISLVQADDLRHLRVPRRDLRRELCEELHAVRRVDERASFGRIDREDDVDSVRARLREGAIEERLVDDRRRSRGIPEHGDSVLSHAQVGERVEEPGPSVLRVLAGVVGDAEGRAARGTREGERADEAGQGRSDRPHMVYVGRWEAGP